MVSAALGWEYYYLGDSEKALEYAKKDFILGNENRDAKRLINQVEKEFSENEKDTGSNKEQIE